MCLKKKNGVLHRASRIEVLVLRGRRINLLLTQEISRRPLFHKDLKDKAMATRAKAKISCPRVENTLGLLTNQSREHVTTATSLDTFDGIAHGGRNPKVMGHLNPNHQRDELGLPFWMGGWCGTIASIPDT